MPNPTRPPPPSLGLSQPCVPAWRCSATCGMRARARGWTISTEQTSRCRCAAVQVPRRWSRGRVHRNPPGCSSHPAAPCPLPAHTCGRAASMCTAMLMPVCSSSLTRPTLSPSSLPRLSPGSGEQQSQGAGLPVQDGRCCCWHATQLDRRLCHGGGQARCRQPAAQQQQ